MEAAFQQREMLNKEWNPGIKWLQCFKECSVDTPLFPLEGISCRNGP